MTLKNVGMMTFIYTTIGGLFSKFEEFLAARSQFDEFDSDHGVNFSAPTCCQSSTFVRPLFAFYCPLGNSMKRGTKLKNRNMCIFTGN